MYADQLISVVDRRRSAVKPIIAIDQRRYHVHLFMTCFLISNHKVQKNYVYDLNNEIPIHDLLDYPIILKSFRESSQLCFLAEKSA